MATETTSSRRGRLGDRWPWILGLGAALFGLVMGWRFVTHPSPRLDASWQMGLHQAIQDGLRFGTDIVFTYGPLGFLSSPTPYLGLTSTLAFLATAGITFVLLLLVFVAARRVLPLWAALIACLLAGALASVVPPFETGQLVLFAAGVEVLRRERVARPMLIAVLAAVLAAIGMLGKVNVGVFLGAGGALVVLAVSPSWWRGLLAYLGSLVVATLALWLVTGQQLPDLAPYAKGSLELISGYSDAMGVTH